LLLGRYAKSVEFNVPFPFKRHEKTNRDPAMFNNASVVKLKLLAEPLPFFRLVPKAARGLNVNAHSPQKDIFEKRYISVGCGSRIQHVR
jgi:hypothetical protein